MCTLCDQARNPSTPKGERAGANLYLHRPLVLFRTVRHWPGAWVQTLAVGGRRTLLSFASLVALPQLLFFPGNPLPRGTSCRAGRHTSSDPGHWSVLSRPVGCMGNPRAQWETRNLALYTLLWFLPVDYPTLYCKRRLVWWIMERIYPSKPWGEGEGEGVPGPGQASSAPAHMAASVNGPPGRGLGRRGARGR